MTACGWCEGAVARRRRDAKFCSKRCRQANWRFRSEVRHGGTTTSAPIRLAYADPPYPGKSGLYRGHPDYAGEVETGPLLSRLQVYDGWALSTSARALPGVLALCPPGVRVAAWFRGSRGGTGRWPRNAWEPVVFAGGRRQTSRRPGDDALIHRARPRTTDPGWVIGAKPAAFCSWLFGLLGALPGDSLADLFPGSGGVSRAWAIFSRRLEDSATDPSPRARADGYPSGKSCATNSTIQNASSGD
jgi:hypothetical protein